MLHKALEAAGLSDLVAALPEGLDTVLGERGTGLSAGERQRVALARAFLRDAPCYCSTNLRPISTAGQKRRCSRPSGGWPADARLSMVAHRPALVALADRVVDLSLVEVAV